MNYKDASDMEMGDLFFPLRHTKPEEIYEFMRHDVDTDGGILDCVVAIVMRRREDGRWRRLERRPGILEITKMNPYEKCKLIELI